MSSSRIVARSSRALFSVSRRPFSAYAPRLNDFTNHNARKNDNADEYRKIQMEKPLNPHMTNTTSTIANEMPNAGQDAAPPELLSATGVQFAPKDAVPENTERMTGGTQGSKDQDVSGANKELKELGVGEMEGASFKVEPLRRTGEDANTMRARLLCPSLTLSTPHCPILHSSASPVCPTTHSLHSMTANVYEWHRPEPQARNPRK